jgi:O-antigen ligase
MKLLFIVLMAFFVFNVAVMVGGKTGYVVLIILTIYYFYDWLGWKGFMPAVLAIAIFGIFTYLSPSSEMHSRGKKFINDISEANVVDWRSPEVKKGSTGLRISFYKNTLKIIIEHPLFGVGTGGYPKAYSQIIKNTEMHSTVNPHNEYLMVTAQLGVLGLCAFLFMFLMQWCLASNLHSNYDKIIARGLVLTIMSASMVSSTIIDLHERTFYIWMSALLFGGYMSCHCSEGNKEIADNKAISE